MGASGSSRWCKHKKKSTVEDSYTIDIGFLMREGLLRGHQSGELQWLHTITGERLFSINIEFYPILLSIQLSYEIIRIDETIICQIQLTPTRPHFGGLRYWFCCPRCTRRCAKIYMPPNSRYFGCRICSALTYQSSQQSDRRLSWLRQHPNEIRNIILNSGCVKSSSLILILKLLQLNRATKQISIVRTGGKCSDFV